MEQSLRHQIADVEADHWWYEARRRILRALISRLGLPKDAAILEMGCGTGANLKMLQEFGGVVACEPDAYSRQEAQKSGVTVEPGMLPGSVPFRQPFDLVGAFDVIEHIDEDLAGLRTLHRMLKKGGYAVFTVPAYQFLWSRHDDVNHHKRRYTRKSFTRVLREAGFEIRLASYFNTFLFPIAFTVLILKKMLKIKDETEVRMPGLKIVNRILCEIFAAERWLLGRVPLPFGLSVIAVCRKN